IKKRKPRHIYHKNKYADIRKSPAPAWNLVSLQSYLGASVQYSRGCPYECEFCAVIATDGHVPRTKSSEQFLNELQMLYAQGWRGHVFIVDDNFNMNKKKLKEELFPALISWVKKHNYPFFFFTQTTIELADDDELMRLMLEAGFYSVLVGIETINDESLKECRKFHNRNRDLAADIKKIQRQGLIVKGTFMLGFDRDDPSVFQKIIDFVQETRIVFMFPFLLRAVQGTKLYQRLSQENRLIKENFQNLVAINYVPKMDPKLILKGCEKIFTSLYSCKTYYNRIFLFIKEFRPARLKNTRGYYAQNILVGLKCILFFGIFSRERLHFWKLLLWALFHRSSAVYCLFIFLIEGHTIKNFFYEFMYRIKKYKLYNYLYVNADDKNFINRQL
ncbi:MAG: DUF4070 domain-containing protein, partial [Candidatus Omnitrophota bacterium]